MSRPPGGPARRSQPSGQDEPVEAYLDQLLLSLRGTPRQVRRTLAEIEAHLGDAVADGVAAGMTEHEAQQAAVDRIGPVGAVSRSRPLPSGPAAALVRRIALSGSLVGGVGLVALALSAPLSWLLAVIRGGAFLTAPFPPGSYTRADCARWLAGQQATHSCVRAMIADHVFDILRNDAAAGVAGLGLLIAYRVLRHRWQDRATITVLPAGTAEAAGAVLAALVAVASFGQAVDAVTAQRGLGAGEPLSVCAAALGAAAFFAVRLWRTAQAGGRPGRRPRRWWRLARRA
jgi:hypothetical protein